MCHATQFLQWHAEHIVLKVKTVKCWLKWISADSGSLHHFQSVDSSKEELKFCSTTLQISLRKCIQVYYKTIYSQMHFFTLCIYFCYKFLMNVFTYIVPYYSYFFLFLALEFLYQGVVFTPIGTIH